MHQALFRKYRPQTFTQVCGQQHISATLKTQVAEQRFSHAYLFTGSRGTGKTSSARILAKAVNCEQPVGGDPCNECAICRGIDNGSIPDIVEIDAASNNSVDNIRELRENIEYTPTVCKYRVYIIDEVHMLTNSAFNALLKTLEEPPAHAIFILATTEVHKIPATILSRCQRYDFNRLSATDIVAYLKHIADSEGFCCEDSAALLIAKLADGGMRDAIQLLDLCASAGEGVSEQTVVDCTGLVDKSYLFDIVSLTERGDAEQLLLLLDRLYNASCDMERLCSELISHYRDLMVAKTAKDYRMLIAAPEEQLGRIYEQSQAVRFESIMHCIAVFSECLDAMKHGSIKRTAVETALLRLCMPTLDSSAAAILARLERLERSGVPTAAAVSAPAPAAAVEPAPPIATTETAPPAPSDAPPAPTAPTAPSAPPAPATDTAEAPLSQWPEIMQRLSADAPVIHSVLGGSTAYTRGNLLLIDAPNALFRQLINGDTSHSAAIKKAALDITGVRYRLGPYKKAAAVAATAADPLDSFIKIAGGDIEVE